MSTKVSHFTAVANHYRASDSPRGDALARTYTEIAALDLDRGPVRGHAIAWAVDVLTDHYRFSSDPADRARSHTLSELGGFDFLAKDANEMPGEDMSLFGGGAGGPEYRLRIANGQDYRCVIDLWERVGRCLGRSIGLTGDDFHRACAIGQRWRSEHAALESARAARHSA